jgi:hypothetical protein
VRPPIFLSAKVAVKKWSNEDIMKTTIRTACAALAVAALCGCGVPKEEHQKLQDECAAVKQQFARAQQDIQALKGALDQKDAETAGLSQQFQAQKTAYEALIKRQAGLIEAAAKGKGTSSTNGKSAAPVAKGKASSKTPAKKAAH